MSLIPSSPDDPLALPPITPPPGRGLVPFRALPRWQQALIVLGALVSIAGGVALARLFDLTPARLLLWAGVVLLGGLAALGVTLSRRPVQRLLGRGLIGLAVVGGLSAFAAPTVVQVRELQERTYTLTITHDGRTTTHVYQHCADLPFFTRWVAERFGVLEQIDIGGARYCRWRTQRLEQRSSAAPGEAPFGNLRQQANGSAVAGTLPNRRRRSFALCTCVFGTRAPNAMSANAQRARMRPRRCNAVGDYISRDWRAPSF